VKKQIFGRLQGNEKTKKKYVDNDGILPDVMF
jgi:hypothetical protein